MTKPTTVAQYLSACPPQARRHLDALRRLVKKVAPTADEKVSYGILGFSLEGPLVYLAGYAGHVSLHGGKVMSPSGPLSKYRSGRGTLRFALDEPLPQAPLTAMVKARLAENQAKAKRPTPRVKRSKA
jgi:uncharacterized protein YdhG (YjbR/CyaY superfamily)